jgi:DNA-binding NtrC family response regulator
MKQAKKVLIVEDQFVEANDLQLMLIKAGYKVCGIARSVTIAQKMIEQERPDLVLLDIFLKGKLTGIDLAWELKKDNIAFIYLSANSNEEILATAKTTEPYGFIVKPFREKDLLVTLEIAQYRHEHSLEARYRREAELQQQLERTIADKDGKQKLLNIATILQQDIPFDFLAAGFNNSGKISYNAYGYLRLGFSEYQVIGLKELLTITGLSMDKVMMLSSATEKDTVEAFFNNESFEHITQQASLKRLFSETFQMRSHLTLPLHLAGEEIFDLGFYSRRADTYNTSHIDLFHRLKPTLVKSIRQLLSVENALDPGTVSYKENTQLPVVISGNAGFESIIGSSHLLLNVFDQITQVAPFDTSVLILGESGTGKERIADSIHGLSPRKGKPFIKVNCAALPAALIESELFGHEKGSFTGATDKRIGKFEQAHGGTIFLDEIGEMPVDLQVKLLRVLQEKEIEPIGGRSTVKINVRVIAATSRSLEKEVAEGRFRLDLYYRLNIFPIVLPPLRDRKEDIPLLVSHFINFYNRKSGKKISHASEKALNKLNAYSWPGNIRELEHLVERSVLIAKSNIIEDIQLPEETVTEQTIQKKELHIKTIYENERDHILAVLKKANGKIWGVGGAAELLNVPPTTLASKMKKLGIKRMFSE